MTRSELRATLVVVVLVVVGVIALWPRSSDDAGSASGPGPSTSTQAPTDPTALADARRDAALAPCPAPSATTPPALGITGLRLDCLGTPGQVDLGAALAGRTTLVNLWASWCGPCREELPALRSYAAGPGAAGVLGVDVADDPTAALALLKAFDVTYPSVSDPDQVVARRTGAVPVLPASVVVRPDGSVVPVPAQVLRTPEQARAAVATAMAAAPGAAR